MSVERIRSHESPGLDALIKNNPELPLKSCCPAPRVVKIPCKMMLDLMLEELALPRARYDFHADGRGRVSAVVMFYISAHMPADLLRPVKMGGAEAVDSEIAEEPAAREAISFMERWENMEVEDLHYGELRYMEKDREDLLKKVEAMQKDKENLQRGLHLAANRMAAFAFQIYNIGCNSRSQEQAAADGNINIPIDLFEGVASDLGHAGQQLLKDLKKGKRFP